MSWSMTSVSFRMSGSGSWENLFPDESSRRLYAGIYPFGVPIPTGPGQPGKLFHSWQQAAIVKFEDQKVLPLGPIMTDDDLGILKPWFHDISKAMCEAVLERLDEYRVLASNLAGGKSFRKQEIDNILTIQICALTLDSWVFTRLRQRVIGTYPPRGFAGNFFFWGYAFASGPQRIFGFTTYSGLAGKSLHMIRSHGLDRLAIKASLGRWQTWEVLKHLFLNRGIGDESALLDQYASGAKKKILDSLQDIGLVQPDDPRRLAIPVLADHDRDLNTELCREVSKKIIRHWMAGMDELKGLVELCSFTKCSWPDCLCMLFHLAYAYAADKLVDRGIIPDFPQKAGGDWGVWIH
ncbi:MAG: hypothetical protein MUQ20_03870 [Deltaproteobacteria bacterium]|nr:hypothetical protein [Deltaproteobacteria bacterium]